VQVPKDPEAFFSSYLPATFEPLRAKLGETSSPGAVVFRVGERPPLAVRIVKGALECVEAVPEDAIVQISVSLDDFEPILVQGAELLLADHADVERQLAVLRALTLDEERVQLIRAVKGSVAFVLEENGTERRVTLTPGSQRANVAVAECTVRAQLSDFLAMQRGAVNPFELLMNGKIQLSGDAQIAMALSSLLV